MTRKKILMAAANHWHSPFQVGSHHLARGFVKAGWDVAFVSDPISPWHVAGGDLHQLKERYRLYAGGGEWDLDGRLWAYVPGALFTPHNKPLLRTRAISHSWAKLACPRIPHVLQGVGFSNVDLIYCDGVVPFSWLREVQHEKAIYRIADQYSAFSKFSSPMRALEQEVARWADVVVYTASTLEEHVKGLHPRNMVHLPNGVNFDHFFHQKIPAPEYASIPKPIAVYVGAMDVWFDWELINFAVQELPDVSFVLIGPDERARTRLKSAGNLYLLGSRPYDALPGYLQHADVGLIPFDVTNYGSLVRSIHPLKLYEYLACGLPVVAIEWEELQYLKSPATLCRSREDFVLGIRQALSSPPDKSSLQRYAADKDWSRTIQKIIDIVGLPKAPGEA
jgi:glycosyltransferase involved in cell wall biosynthesis